MGFQLIFLVYFQADLFGELFLLRVTYEPSQVWNVFLSRETLIRTYLSVMFADVTKRFGKPRKIYLKTLKYHKLIN